jgi:hypothetical protein
LSKKSKRMPPAMARDASPLNVLSSSQLPPSPPAEKATARQDQAGQSGTGRWERERSAN